MVERKEQRKKCAMRRGNTIAAPRADRLRLEIEKDSLTRKLWELVEVDKPGEGSGSASAATRAEVARVWPIVAATFERLTAGVDSLMTRLAQESQSAERDRA